jgi:predicted anti-sigma-YlaC factor YlaD
MNCTEFQNELPHIIDGGGTAAHEEHLRECEICRDLVNDLRFIADQAKLLVNMEEPSPKVWNGIAQKLKVEGLVKPAVARGPMQRAGDRFD